MVRGRSNLKTSAAESSEDFIPPLNILLIDDNPDDRALTIRVLQKENPGLKVQEVFDAIGLSEALKRGGFDLAITDYELVWTNGLTILREIKAHYPDCPVIMFTGSGDEEIAVEAMKAGLDDYILKSPKHAVRLPAAIRVVLEQAEGRQARSHLEMRLQRTLNRLNKKTEELERSNRELEQFAYVASHDLQEPLRKIIAFGSRLKEVRSSALGDRGNEYLDRMMVSADRMQRLVEDLLRCSRVEKEAKPFEEVNLEGLIYEVLTDLEIEIKKSGAKIEVGELPPLHADPVQMRELFQNLVSNAVKFRKAGVLPRVKITGRPAPKEEGIEITVADNGIGFDEKYADRIFRPFQRLHSRDEFEGSGVGLAICRKIAERHGGRIAAKSKPGEGAAFVITFPTERS